MEILAPVNDALPSEYKLIERIRDLWANNCSDSEIRDLLKIDKEQWNALMGLLKELNDTVGDNRIAFEKYLAKQLKRGKELEQLRNYATATEQLNTSIKCFQLEADIDRSLVEMAQRLGVLKGEVIEIKGKVDHNIRLAAILSEVPVELQESARNDLKELTQALIAEGIILNDNAGPSNTK
jgi:oligoendopeptidase F